MFALELDQPVLPDMVDGNSIAEKLMGYRDREQRKKLSKALD